jgi:flagellar biosynthesis/type III secretory pathway M-ring protein FliF/YscJ
MTSINLVTETYDPTKKVAKKEEIKSNSETEAGTVPAEGEEVIPGGIKKDETIVTEYAVAKTVEQRVDLPGEIKSLSVAAFVDLSPPVFADANEAETTGSTEPIMAKADVEEIITNALGLKETDSLTVVDVKFHRPLELLTDEEEPGGLNFIAIARQSSLGIMAICVFLALRVFTGAKKKAAPAAAAGQLPGAEGPAGLLPAEAGGSESIVLRRQIADVLHNNPEQGRQLFTSWLAEKGE